MKKKILLLILLLLIPFIVKAEDPISKLHKRWDFNEKYYDFNLLKTTNRFIFVNDGQIRSIDKISGEEIKRIGYDYYYINGEKIVIFSNSDTSLKITIYNEDLNVIDEKNFNNLELDYITNKNDYIFLTGNRKVGNDYYRDIYYLDFEVNTIRSDSYKTIQKTSFGLDKSCSKYRDQYMFVDFNFNRYNIDNYKIVPKNVNSDGTIMYLTNTKLYKKSATGEIIATFDIPNGKGTRMAKKDGKYYIGTGVYTKVDNRTHIDLQMYTVDENLNLISSGMIEGPEGGTLVVAPEGGYGDYYHMVSEYYDKLDFSFNYEENIKLSGYFNDDYSYTQVNIEFPYTRTSPYVYPIINNNSNNFFGYKEESKETRQAIQAKLKVGNRNPEVQYVKFDNQYVAIVYYSTSTDDYYTYTVKTELVYLDNDLNVTKRITINDTEIFNYSLRNNNIAISKYEGYIVVGTSTTKGNTILVYDQQGNLVKDMAEYVTEYNHLSIQSIETTDKGIFILFDNTLASSKLKGVSTETKVLSQLGPSYEIAMVYFSNFYAINKAIVGDGNITTTLEQAEEGTVIRFTVEPKPGYVLGAVKVTDAYGNVLTFTDYTFTMPNADVTIEATFVKATNPNTNDIAILSIIFIAFTSGVILYIQKKKQEFLK